MNLTRNRTIALIGGSAAVIGLGVIAGPVLADNVIGGDHRDADHDDFAKDLAGKLGVPQAKVDDALKSMMGDHLAQRIDELQQSGALTADQATSIKAKIAANNTDGALKELRGDLASTQLAALVQKGTITQDQADQVEALIKAGAPVGLRMGPDGRQHAESADHQKHQVQELQQRGAITADQAKEITALIDAGKTDQAETAIHGAMDAGMLTQLVQQKVVTQAQADQISALIAAGVPIGLGGPGMDGHHGPDMDGDHRGPDMDGDHGMGGQPPQGGNGGFQQQSYGSDASNA